jgi:hypothetical protein
MSLAETLKNKAAIMKNTKSSTKPTKSEKPAQKKAAKKSGKKVTRTPRVQIKDGKGNPVTGRNEEFFCKHCKKNITGPWSYKTHLVKIHEYTREQAGLRKEK